MQMLTLQVNAWSQNRNPRGCKSQKDFKLTLREQILNLQANFPKQVLLYRHLIIVLYEFIEKLLIVFVSHGSRLPDQHRQTRSMSALQHEISRQADVTAPQSNFLTFKLSQHQSPDVICRRGAFRATSSAVALQVVTRLFLLVTNVIIDTDLIVVNDHCWTNSPV